MVTTDPIPVVPGEKLVIVGVVLKTNPLREDFPPELLTFTLPEAPVPTTAVMVVADWTVKELAGMPPKLMESTPERLVPLIVIVAPGPPVEGVKEVIIGAGIKLNPPRDAVAEPVDTDTLPVAPDPT